MQFQLSFAFFVVAACCFVSALAAEQPKQSPQSAAPVAGDRNKRGLYASPYLAPYAASPYVASPYAASPYVAAASPYVASPYVAPHYPYGARAISSYATYPYVAKTFASPYAYYP